MSQCCNYPRITKPLYMQWLRTQISNEKEDIYSMTLSYPKTPNIYTLQKAAMFTTILLDQWPIWFQLDYGASCNVILSNIDMKQY